MINEINTWDKDYLICPYCGHEQAVDSTFEGDEGEYEVEKVCCEECGKTFIASREVEFHYMTYKDYTKKK